MNLHPPLWKNVMFGTNFFMVEDMFRQILFYEAISYSGTSGILFMGVQPLYMYTCKHVYIQTENFRGD